MRDAHRMKEKFDLSLDNRQIVSLLIAGIVVLGAVFVLGVVVGKKLSESDRSAGAPDLLSALDEKAAAMDKVHSEPATTFQEELTKKAAPVPREAAVKPAKPDASAQAKPESKPAAEKSEAKVKPSAGKAEAEKPEAKAEVAVASSAGEGTAGEASRDEARTEESRRDAVVDKKTEPSKPAKPESAKSEPSKPDSAKHESETPLSERKETLAERIKATATAPLEGKVAEGSGVPTRTVEKGGEKGGPASSAAKAKTEAKVEAKAETVPAGKGAFTLQLSATQTREEADRFASSLKAKGYAPYIVAAQVPGKGTWYRVRLGGFPSRDAASRYLQDFRRETQMDAFVASSKDP